MRNTSLGLALLALVAFAPAAASAQQFTVGPTAAWHEDADFGIGINVGRDLPEMSDGVGVQADFIYFFPDGFDLWELNANLTYDFPLENSSVLPFVLGGLNVASASVDVGSESVSNTDLGLNIGGGIGFDAGSLRPQVGAKYEIGGGESFVVFVTVPFRTGG